MDSNPLRSVSPHSDSVWSFGSRRASRAWDSPTSPPAAVWGAPSGATVQPVLLLPPNAAPTCPLPRPRSTRQTRVSVISGSTTAAQGSSFTSSMWDPTSAASMHEVEGSPSSSSQGAGGDGSNTPQPNGTQLTAAERRRAQQRLIVMLLARLPDCAGDPSHRALIRMCLQLHQDGILDTLDDLSDVIGYRVHPAPNRGAATVAPAPVTTTVEDVSLDPRAVDLSTVVTGDGAGSDGTVPISTALVPTPAPPRIPPLLPSRFATVPHALPSAGPRRMASLPRGYVSSFIAGQHLLVRSTLARTSIQQDPRHSRAAATRPFRAPSRFKDDFEVLGELGKGGFGKVFRVRHKIDRAEYAVKCIQFRHDEFETGQTNKVLREVHLLARLDHRNIVRYYTAWVEAAWVDDSLPALEDVQSRSAMVGGYRVLGSPVAAGSLMPAYNVLAIQDKPAQQQQHAGSQSKAGDTVAADSSSSGAMEPNRSTGDSQFDCASSSNASGTQTGSGSDNESNGESGSGSSSGSGSGSDSDSDSDSGSGAALSSAFPRRLGLIRGRSSTSADSMSGSGVFSFNEDTTVGSAADLFRVSQPWLSVSGTGAADGAGPRAVTSAPPGASLSSGGSHGSSSPELASYATAAATAASARAKRVRYNHVLYVQMALCSDVTLRDWLNKRKAVCLSESLAVFRQLLDALDHVHAQRVIHRDLKPSNCFIGLDGTVKLGDFGLSKDMFEPASSPVAGGRAHGLFRTTHVSTSPRPRNAAGRGGSGGEQALVQELPTTPDAQAHDRTPSTPGATRHLVSASAGTPASATAASESSGDEAGVGGQEEEEEEEDDDGVDAGVTVEVLGEEDSRTGQRHQRQVSPPGPLRHRTSSQSSTSGLGSDTDDVSELGRISLQRVSSNSTNASHTSAVGTRSYASPEQLAGPDYTVQSDMFSLGLILMELLCRFPTKMERAMAFDDARERQIVPRTIRTSFPALASLIRLLLHPDPTKRPTARSLLQHPACARSMATVKSPVLRIVREHDSEYCNSGSDVAGDGMHSVSDSDSKGVDGCDAENATRKTAVCSAADDTGESEGEGEGESEGGGEGEGEGAVAGTPTAPTGTDPCGRSPQEKDRLIRHQQREIEALRQEVEQLRKELVARASRCLCCATRAAQEGNGGPKASLS